MEVAKLKIIVGPMFSSKSSRLIGELSVYQQIGLKVMYINHSLDTRNKQSDFSTHNPTLKDYKGNILNSLRVLTLSEIEEGKLKSTDVIGIDEAQFFPDLMKCVRWVEDFGVTVIVCGLDGDFERKKFGQILDLIPYSDSVTKLHAYCRECCDHKKLRSGVFTQRTIKNDDTIVVGGKEIYQPVCRECYLKSK